MAVHAEDQVEGDKIGRVDLSTALIRNVDAVGFGDRNRAPVGRMADMPCADAGGIDRDQVVITRAARQLAHHPLGQRRPADIAETNEENSDGFHVIHRRSGKPPRHG
ncbi:hypothetical protein AB395_00003596 [Sinorhizobium fredii CCBAU 45436]|nr:hypothetical protein AB395_00003596 [Sinorhizobium fredii CCBAU 45436]